MRGMRGIAVAGTLGLVLGCGDGGVEDGEANALQPMAVGTTWTYRTSRADGTQAEEKTTTVIRREERDGLDTAVLETVRQDRESLVWLGVVDGIVRRVREETREPTRQELRRFEPGAVRTPASLEGLRVGQVFPSVYDEIWVDEAGEELGRISRSPVWTVEAVGEQVEVPAGRFGTVRLLRRGDDEDGPAEKRLWYAPGVGKVKEAGKRLEVLLHYQHGGD